MSTDEQERMIVLSWYEAKSEWCFIFGIFVTLFSNFRNRHIYLQARKMMYRFHPPDKLIQLLLVV